MEQQLTIDDNVSISSNCIITCRDTIKIGSDVSISPDSLIDDHDYLTKGVIWAGKYKTETVNIGDNCWKSCNTVILKGTQIGNNCVVGAGDILKGVYPDGSVIVQKRETKVRIINEVNGMRKEV
ncbi:acyltransferase [Eubacterium callanderi]|uniref:acyltransferase n=1 Tax=Eubacterium callanderi TaxID=53442 RepID=UPI0029FF2136|nr:acyltransferase [Eubacterium callanderi]